MAQSRNFLAAETSVMAESTDSLPGKDDFGFDGPFLAGPMLDCLDLGIDEADPHEKDNFGFDGPMPDEKDDFGFDGPMPDEKDDFGFNGPMPDVDLVEMAEVLDNTGTRLLSLPLTNRRLITANMVTELLPKHF